MCGRFVLVTDLSVIARDFDIPDAPFSFSPNRNISPGQQIAAVIRRDNQHILASYLWGLIPFWAKDPSIGAKLINARAETVTQKPSFKNAFARRRCLIPADGFYEWKKEEKKKIPYYFFLKSGRPFCFAGLHETWIPSDKQPVHTCTIITTQANEVVSPIHNRMPVIIPKDMQSLWLDTTIQDASKLLDILKPCPAEELACEPAKFQI